MMWYSPIKQLIGKLSQVRKIFTAQCVWEARGFMLVHDFG